MNIARDGLARSVQVRLTPDTRPIIVFDALCVLCSANARFVLRHDRAGRFRLASAQGEVGGALCETFHFDARVPDSIFLVDGDTALRDSDAVLAIASGLGWPWRALAAFAVVPRMVRDGLYRWIARNRYRLFGRLESCTVLDPAYADRIL